MVLQAGIPASQIGEKIFVVLDNQVAVSALRIWKSSSSLSKMCSYFDMADKANAEFDWCQTTQISLETKKEMLPLVLHCSHYIPASYKQDKSHWPISVSLCINDGKNYWTSGGFWLTQLVTKIFNYLCAVANHQNLHYRGSTFRIDRCQYRI